MSCSTIGTEVLDLVANSSFHGIPNIVKSKHWLIRCMWVVAFAASFYLSWSLAYTQLLVYLEYKVNVNMDKTNMVMAPFPTISICDSNPYYTSTAVGRISDVIRKASDSINGNITMMFPLNTFDQNVWLIKYLMLSDDITPRIEKYTSNDVNYLKSLGYPLNKMLLSCQYYMKPCSEADFTWIYSFYYGSCWRFNANKTYVKKAYGSGSAYGLSIELMVDNADDPNTLSVSNGVHIYIDNSSTKIPYLQSGLDAAAGTNTEISIKRSYRRQLSSPYSSCVSNLTQVASESSNYFRRVVEIFSIYSQDQCIAICFQHFFNKFCNCSVPLIHLNGYPACTMDKLECNGEAYLRLKIELVSQCAETSCPPECETIKFKTAMSFSPYPTLAYYDANLRAKGPIVERFGVNASYDEVKLAVIRLNIFYSSLELTTLTDTPSQDLISFVSAVGGTIGLYIGSSLISFFEVFDIILIIWCNIWSPKSKPNITSPKKECDEEPFTIDDSKI